MKTLSLLLTVVSLMLAPAVQAKTQNGRFNSQLVSAYEISNKTPKAKVARFQREQGLRIDGIVGPETRACVNAVTSKEKPRRAIFVRAPQRSKSQQVAVRKSGTRVGNNIHPTALQEVGRRENASQGPFKRVAELLKKINFRPRPTIYWTPTATGKGNAIMRSPSGQVLAQVSWQNKKEAEIEGNIQFSNGTLNFQKYKYFGRGKKRFRDSTWAFSPHPRGKYTSRLKPFRSIAIDPRRVTPGSDIWIKELVGIPLPGEKKPHDGWCEADNIGSGIKGDRIDIYCGPKTYRHYLAQFGIKHLGRLSAIVIRPPKFQQVAGVRR